jgi:hypothetical protein
MKNTAFMVPSIDVFGSTPPPSLQLEAATYHLHREKKDEEEVG